MAIFRVFSRDLAIWSPKGCDFAADFGGFGLFKCRDRANNELKAGEGTTNNSNQTNDAGGGKTIERKVAKTPPALVRTLIHTFLHSKFVKAIRYSFACTVFE